MPTSSEKKFCCPFCKKSVAEGTCCSEFSELKLKNRNARLKRLLELNAPESIVEKERELIGQAEAEIRSWGMN